MASTQQRPQSTTGTREKTYFEQQREALIGEIAMSFEHVLANINKLNRSLEAVVAVGNEFSSVEALWSQFETVMGNDAEEQEDEEEEGPVEGGGQEQDADIPDREHTSAAEERAGRSRS